nr:hypothetical protein [Myxococcota bacterium]
TQTAGIVLGLAGVALGGGALYFALDARAQAAELEGYKGEWGDDQSTVEERGQRGRKLAWGLGLVGAGAVGVGVVLVVLGRSASETRGVAIAPRAGGAEVSWTLRY